MTFLHRAGALVLAAFILAHIGNHIAAAFGPGVHDNVMTALRVFYRDPRVEPFLIGLLILQAASGAALAFDSFKRPAPRGAWSWIELVAGLVFLVFIIAHLAAISVTRFALHLDTDFYWVAALMSDTRYQPYVAGLHALGVIAVTTHIGAGLRYMIVDFGAPKFAGRVAVSFIVFGVAAAAISLAAYSGALYTIDLPPELAELVRRVR